MTTDWRAPPWREEGNPLTVKLEGQFTLYVVLSQSESEPRALSRAWCRTLPF